MSEALLSIDKVAKQSGIASSALRYYERCGLIPEGVKIGGRRHYEPFVLHRLSVIKACQKIGLNLSQIGVLLSGAGNPAGGGSSEAGSWQRLLLDRRKLILEQIQELHHVLELLDTVLTCSCHELRDCPRMGPDGDLARPPDGQPRSAQPAGTTCGPGCS